MTATTTGDCVVRDEDAFLALEDDWSALHSRARGTVFQTFAWNRLWWKLYGANFSLRVIVVRDGESVVGILPLFREEFRVVSFALSRVRFLGGRETYGEYGPLIDPAYRDVALAAIADVCHELLTTDVDFIDLYRFSSTSTTMKELRNALRSRGASERYFEQVTSHVVMPLPDSWEKYLDQIGAEKQMLLRRTKSLTKAGVSLEIVNTEEQFPKAFDEYVFLHGASWARRGAGGYFKFYDHFEEFLRTITAEFMRVDESRLYFFTHEGKRIAAVHAFFVNDECCFYLSGLDRTHPMMRFSPGKVLLSLVIKDAIARGLTRFDFQGGDESYKFRLGGKLEWFSQVVIWSNRRANFRVQAFLLIARIRTFLLITTYENTILPLYRKIFGKA